MKNHQVFENQKLNVKLTIDNDSYKLESTTARLKSMLADDPIDLWIEECYQTLNKRSLC